jgi:uncharacterized protein (TIGR02246 family)
MPNQAYDDLRQKYIRAYSAGNAAGIARVFSPDCILLAPDTPIARGQAGVQAFYEGQFSQMTPSSLTITPEEEVMMGDWGYSAGSFVASVTLKANGAQLDVEGKYLNFVKKQADGSWALHRHTWNAPTQLAALATPMTGRAGS